MKTIKKVSRRIKLKKCCELALTAFISEAANIEGERMEKFMKLLNKFHTEDEI